MNEEKIELVARALAKADGFDPDYETEDHRRRPSGKKIWQNPVYLNYARAAVAALGHQ